MSPAHCPLVYARIHAQWRYQKRSSRRNTLGYNTRIIALTQTICGYRQKTSGELGGRLLGAMIQ